jgi:hypothetical protein
MRTAKDKLFDLFPSDNLIDNKITERNDPDYDSPTDNPADKTKTFDGQKDSFHDGTPSNKDNTIITENAEKLNQNNSGSKEILKNALNKELTNLEANPGSDADAYAKKKYDLNNELKN